MSRLVTRSGIVYDLSISSYKVRVCYGAIDELTFIFSSELYRDKFIEKQEENRKRISESLSKRFGFNIKMDKLADLTLYIRTEKRGFLIKGEEEYTCLDTIILDGVKLMKRN